MSEGEKRVVRAIDKATGWALMWHSEDMLDGVTRHLIYDPVGVVKLTRTRREMREYADEKYGYIKHREDLRCEPHGWRFPQPVRVVICAALRSGKRKRGRKV